MKRVGLRLAPGVVAAVPGDDNDAPWDGNINLFRPSGSISPMLCRFAAFCCRSCSRAIECDGKCRVSRDSIIHYWPDTVRSNAAPSARSGSIESSSSLLCFLALATSPLILANARPCALPALAPSASVLADARSSALLALAPFPSVLADARR